MPENTESGFIVVANFIRRAPITVILVAMNLIMLIVLASQGSLDEPNAIMNMLASYTPAIINEGEYYRLFTSMFLHFGIEHLIGNMLLLFFLGEIIEVTLGKVRYLFIYLVGGIVGNVASLFMELGLPINQMPISAGASGAVFALIGAMAYILILNKGRLAGVSLRRLMILILLSIWEGYNNRNVDGVAHVGGLIAGFLFALILYHKSEVDNNYVDDIV